MTKVDHEALEELLRHASPRPMPSVDDEAAVRTAVRAEWRDLTGKRKTRRRAMHYAIAATVLIGLFAVFSTLRTPDAGTVRVAMIEKSVGPVYLLGEEAELRETPDLAAVLSGQTIITGTGAGLAIVWEGGGSIRLDENSRIEFTNDHSVFLESGRIYFDSHNPSQAVGINAGNAPRLTLRTELGDVRHLGTQYMAAVDSGRLTVSVREGQVAIDGTYHDHVASPGQQVSLVGSAQPSILSISASSDAWSWIHRTAVEPDVDGKSLHEFLTWVCREMGLELKFQGQAESVARQAILKGSIDTEPAEALRLRLASAALYWHIDEGVIYISDTR